MSSVEGVLPPLLFNEFDLWVLQTCKVSLDSVEEVLDVAQLTDYLRCRTRGFSSLECTAGSRDQASFS